MTLPAPAVVPPMVLFVAAVDEQHPMTLPQAGRAGDVGADVVAFDEVVRSAHIFDTQTESVFRLMMLRAAAVAPPMVLSCAPNEIETPELLAIAALPATSTPM